MKAAILIGMLLMIPLTINAQNTEIKTKEDTLYKWRSNFFDVSISEISPNGRWLALNKWRNLVADTLLLIDTEHTHLPPLQIVKMRQLYFTAGDHLLSLGADTAAWWDLSTRSSLHYKNIAHAVLLSDINCYALLDKSHRLQIWNSSGQLLLQEENIWKITADGGSNLLFFKKENNDALVYNWDQKSKKKIFETSEPVNSINWDFSEKYVILNLIRKDFARPKVVMINRQTGNPDFSLEDKDAASGYYHLTEIDENNFFIQKETQENLPRKKVELWYGNDGDLIKTQIQQNLLKEYAIWNAISGKIQELPTDEYPTICNMGNTRYFLAFNTAANRNYIRWTPDVETFIYDALQKKYLTMGKIREEVVVSPDGNYLLYQTPSDQWSIFDLKTQQNTKVASSALRAPLFDAQSRTVFFESDNGIHTYDIAKQRLHLINKTKGLKAKIINRHQKSFSTEFRIYSNALPKNKAVLFTLYNQLTDKTATAIYYKDQYRMLLLPTQNALNDLRYNEKSKALVYREENYNLFPVIKRFYLNNKEELLYQNTTQNKRAQKVHQEVITYMSNKNIPLKGLLYYPTGFDPHKKYPLIVHIYQILSVKKNDFIAPGEGSTEGFDLPALLEKGYFVYLPDIVYDERGTGISALDCVNKALDALQNKTFLDMAHVGLTGHSHGGYETNFIATHSDRFAAYISGAGNSDIIRSYFSYNYNFSGPFYWQFEHGQYEMPVPFAQNKQLYLDNSPIYNVDKVSAPILLWAGKKDMNIAWDQVMEFFVGLKRHHKDTVALFYPDQGHDVSGNTPEMRDLNDRVIDWWEYFLKDRKDIPWIQKQMKKDAG